ncbi:hypothetical protein PLICRDRAFT_503094 [Plicaturopsis crispa FD-325 SS-3]|nr:hypothetical protein PLICRDRAFT_503094 [Plicaturopsis crispa FD-325 SS-3]
MIEMSYPYQNYSDPSTPVYPWEVDIATVEQQQHQAARRQQQQQQVHAQPQVHPQHAQHIMQQQPYESLPLPERIVPSQSLREVGHSNEPVHLHPIAEERSEGDEVRHHKPDIHIDTGSRASTSPSAASTSTIGPIRVSPTTRSHHQAALHPYRRPTSATSGRQRMGEQEHTRFMGPSQASGSSIPPHVAPPPPPVRIPSHGSNLRSTRYGIHALSRVAL